LQQVVVAVAAVVVVDIQCPEEVELPQLTLESWEHRQAAVKKWVARQVVHRQHLEFQHISLQPEAVLVEHREQPQLISRSDNAIS
uniref:Secreted protein n=2 Tax=Gongylonema pulchrum TaxID=637853 RepID=A0A183EV47_9BILA